jgi:F0F1-type ATP synthase membrane subunit a
LIPTLIILLVTFLEVAIGFLQAYVFVTLSAIYTNDGLNAVH